MPPVPDPDDDGVWDQNVAALDAFLSVATQWRMVPLATGRLIATGLDYQAARAGIEMTGTDITPDLWFDVRMIEAGAMGAMNEDGK